MAASDLNDIVKDPDDRFSLPDTDIFEVIEGLSMVGEVASTIEPVPVGATAVVIANVPDEVIDAGVTDRIDGTVIPTEVTVPVVGVVQVIAVPPP